jgi:hypothetical protein
MFEMMNEQQTVKGIPRDIFDSLSPAEQLNILKGN